MIDVSAQRRAFRNGIVKDVMTAVSTMVGALQAPPRVVDIPIVLGTTGVPLLAGKHVFLRLGLNGQASVLTWSVAATVAGASSVRTVQLDLRVGATLATVASICGLAANRPQLSSQSERADQVPTSWTTTVITDPSWVYVTVMSADGTVEVVGLTLRVAVSPR